MRHDEDIRGSDGTDQERGRVGRPEFRRWTRGRVALLLAAAIGPAWLPAIDPPPENLPDAPRPRRFRGPDPALRHRPRRTDHRDGEQRGRVRLRRAVDGGGIEREITICGRAGRWPSRPTAGSSRSEATSPTSSCTTSDRSDGNAPWDSRPDDDRPEVLARRADPGGGEAHSPDIILWDIGAARPRDPAGSFVEGDGPCIRSRRPVAGLGGLDDQVVMIWDLETGPTATPDRADAPDPTIASSPDGRLLASVSSARDGSGSGTSGRAARSGGSPATRSRFIRWRSRRTAGCWRRQPATGPRASGSPRPAGPAHSTARPTRSRTSRSARRPHSGRDRQ